MRSPFKFLNAFTRNDHAAFFAREEEVQRLYEMISKNRLIMIYGPSGSGKTSLVQCGLSARFDVTDWYPLFIRRKEDINLSLQYALIQALDGRGGADIAESVEDIYATYLRPAFLIFDQLEELLILGSEEEQQQFFRSMAALLQAELPCRIIFIFREDYLAHLYRFERIIPSLFNRRLRVEQMNRTQIEEVITRSCALFNMKLQPEEEVITQITDRLLAGNQSLGLPYLQVYLDRLYRTVFQKTYQRERKGEELPLLEISQDEIEALGVIDEVMEQFLLEQQKSVQSTLERSYTALPDDFTADVLDRFVSFEGTKQPVPFYEKVDGIAFGLDLFDSLLRQFPKAALVSCLELLERSRVLVKKDNVLEIAHDSLALLINDNRTTQQKQLNRVRQRISNAYQEFLISHSLLGKAPLRTIEPFLEQLEPELESGPLAFVRDSIAAVEQAERQELEQERKKRVRNRNLAIIGFTLLAVTTVASLVAFVQWKRVEQAKREVDNALFAEKWRAAEAAKFNGEYDTALIRLYDLQELAEKYFTTNRTEMVAHRLETWTELRMRMQAGDSLLFLEDYFAALQSYASAFELAPDNKIRDVLDATQKTLDDKFNDLVSRGDDMIRMNAANRVNREQALGLYEKALRLKPEDENLIRKMEEIKKSINLGN